MRQSGRRALAVIVALSLALAAAGLAAAAITRSATGTSGTTGSTGQTGPSPTTSKPKLVACPAGVASSGADQWVWSAYGAPSSSSSTVTYSQSGGNGTWNGGQAKGTICSQDQGGGEPKRSIVLSVSGPSTLTPNTKKLGLVGIAIVLPVSVSKSGDAAVCPVGATGTVKLFASYYGVHDDKASLSFAGTCSAWDETFTGKILHVEISHDGSMIR